MDEKLLKEIISDLEYILDKAKRLTTGNVAHESSAIACIASYALERLKKQLK